MTTGTHHHSDDIAYPSSIGFVLIHLGCFAAFWTGVTWRAAVTGDRAVFAAASSRSAPATIATSPIAPSAPSRFFSSAWRSWRRPRRSAARCGGPRSIVCTTNTRIPWTMCIHRCCAAFSIPMSAGSSCREMTRRTTPSCATWPATRSWCGLIASPTCQPRCSLLATWLIAGLPGLAIGFCWSTVVLWHATFSINSLAHVVGRQRYVTGDQSRNNWLLALLTMGEGWHNNHHAYQASVRQGFRWWEYDPTYYVAARCCHGSALSGICMFRRKR